MKEQISLFIAHAHALLLSTAALAHAQVDARMLRQPDVSATHITFVYAGDIWIVPKSGGTAQRLSSPRGEENFPRFFAGPYVEEIQRKHSLPLSGPTEEVRSNRT